MWFVHWLSTLGTVVAALLIVIDPLGALPIVISATAFVGPRNGKKLILRVVGGSTILLLFFTVAGTWVLQLFGVSLCDMQIGGGLLLLILALKIVAGGRLGGHEGDESHMAMVVPLISPLIIGPGAITASIVLAAKYGVWIALAGAVAAMIVCLILFMTSRIIHRLIGDPATDLISRVMGVFVAAIAIAYMRNGVLDVIGHVCAR